MYAPGLTYAPRTAEPGQQAVQAVQKAAETASSFLDQKDYSWPPPVSSLPALIGNRLITHALRLAEPSQ